MNLITFNRALALSWLLVLIGGILLNPGAGLIGGGLLLLVITLLCARLGGVVQLPPEDHTEEAG